MKILKSVQNSLRFLGIHKPEPNCNRFTWKRLLILYLFVQTALSTIAFFLIEAKSFRDYTYSLYGAASSTLYVSCFSLMIYYMENIFKLIEKLEYIIETRKFATLMHCNSCKWLKNKFLVKNNRKVLIKRNKLTKNVRK